VYSLFGFPGAVLHTVQHAFLCFSTVLKRRFCRDPLARFGRFAAARSLVVP